MSFPQNFLWGAASAAPQVEGGWNEGGRTPSIWDVGIEGKVKHNETPHVACDTYHRYREDAKLMKSLGLRSYRFSVSWSRVMPEEGVLNPEGLRFYSDFVDALLEQGIEPLVTLYHWDQPLWMYERGGWQKDNAAQLFAQYAAALAKTLGDRVTYWITFNEPSVFVGQGYKTGTHAPFRRDDLAVHTAVSRGVLLAHGMAVKAIRENAEKTPKIGMSLAGGGFTPVTEDAAGIEEARFLTYENSPGCQATIWWSDTAIFGRPPEALAKVLSADDLKTICQPLDFFGYNIYHSKNFMDGKPGVYSGMPRTSMGWTITPEILYWLTRFHYERYHLPILVTENGMANTDFTMLDGKVHDPQRCDFVLRYLAQLKKAVDEGIPVLGYQYWSLVDNFEWAEGYDKRFGIVYVDYRTGERIPKDSAWLYRDIIAANGENLPGANA